MKRLAFALSALALCASPALAQIASGAFDQGATIAVTNQGGGLTAIGSPFGVWAPYVDSIIQAAVVALGSWVLWVLKTKFGVDVDNAQAQKIQMALSNQAGSLIADGAIRIVGGKVVVDREKLDEAAAAIYAAVPDALKHFNMDDAVNLVKDKIIDKVPQTTAGAQMMAAAAALPPAAPASASTETTKANLEPVTQKPELG